MAAFWDRLIRPAAGAAGESEAAAPATGAAAPAESYRAAGLSFSPASPEEVLATRAGDGLAALLPRHEAEYLGRCGYFAPLVDHAARLAAELGLPDYLAGEIMLDLERLAAAGWLQPLSPLVSGWPREEPGAPISALAVVTANRPDTLRRCLKTFLDNARRHGRSPDAVVFDDSPEVEVRAADRAMLRQVAAERGSAARYVGAEEKRAYAAALVGAGCPADAVEFCLFGRPGYGPAIGANHNAELLDFVGEAVLAVDDDVHCRLCPAPDALPGLALRPGDPTDFWFYPSLEEAAAAGAAADVDCLGLHEAVLGKSPRACGDGTELDADDADFRLLSAFARGRGRVAVTTTGLAGDAAMGSVRYFLAVPGESGRRLTEDPDAYPGLMAARAVVRVPRRLTLGDGGWFMGYGHALDLRGGLLPPFFPLMRNPDDVFGRMLAWIDPDVFLGLLPWTVAHEPPRARLADRAALGQPIGAALAPEVMMALLGQGAAAALLQGGPADRLAAMGAWFAALGRLPEAEFVAFVQGYLRRERAATLAWYEQAARDGAAEGRGTEWEADIAAVIRALRASFAAGGPAGGEVHPSARPLIGDYGRLLAAWPDLVETARRLKAGGVRLSAPA
jgi:hypothetical protein